MHLEKRITIIEKWQLAGEGEYAGNKRLRLAEEARGGRWKGQGDLKRNALLLLLICYCAMVLFFCVYTFFIVIINVCDHIHFADERNDNCWLTCSGSHSYEVVDLESKFLPIWF